MIVTVAGTGSEMNGGAVITNEEQKVKTGRDYPKCNARFALMDPYPILTAYQNSRWRPAALIFFPTSWRPISASRMRPMSDDISEALMRGVIRDLRAAIQNPEDYTASAKSDVGFHHGGKTASSSWANGWIFECHQMEHQLEHTRTGNHGAGLAVLHPVYYRHIYKDGLTKFQKFAVNVGAFLRKGKQGKNFARAGVEALADFIKDIGLPTTLRNWA